MDITKPILDPVTLYRIELYGSVDVEWLQGFDSSMEIIDGESKNKENATVLQYTHRSIWDRRAGAQVARAGNNDPAGLDYHKKGE